MNILAIDIGGATRNGWAVITDKEILVADGHIDIEKRNKGEHRRYVSSYVRDLVQKYDISFVLVERVKLFKGNNISKLANIESLSRLVGAITDKVYDLCPIRDVEVRTWKSKILRNTSSDKTFSVNYVLNQYKEEVVHDEADAICLAIYAARYNNSSESLMKDISNR